MNNNIVLIDSNLSFQNLTSSENIILAYKDASKNKGFRKATLLFEKNLAYNLNSLKAQLFSKTYHHGSYRFFSVYDQKERQISAAPFCDRIVHHAVYQIIEPIFNQAFIFDSFANRKDKGSHKAVQRLQKFLRARRSKCRRPYCLKCDIAKCFPSINHQILLKLIEKRIKDKEIIWLIKQIVDSFETGSQFDNLFPKNSPFIRNRPRGIPIGNLTSQLFVNIYLDSLDKYVKHHLKIGHYLRYVDDFLILHPNKKYLHQIRQDIEHFLRSQLNLELHPKKQAIFPIEQGIDFLGYVVFPNHCFLRKSNKQAFKKRLRKMRKAYLKQSLKKEFIQASITSWLAHAEHAKTYRLRTRIFGQPLTAKDQDKISQFIDSWKNEPIREPSGQLRLF